MDEYRNGLNNLEGLAKQPGLGQTSGLAALAYMQQSPETVTSMLRQILQRLAEIERKL